MIKNLFVHSYRNLEKVRLDDLGRINLLFGENNTGKTSFLECIQLIKDEAVLSNLIRVAQKRELDTDLAMKNKSKSFQSLINVFDVRQGSTKTLRVDFDTKWGNWEVGLYGEEFEEDFLLGDHSGDYSSVAEARTYYVDSPQFVRGLKGYYWYNNTRRDYEISEQGGNRFVRYLKHVQIPVEFVSPIDCYLGTNQYRILNEIVKSGEKDFLVELLNVFDKNIINFEILYENNKVSILIEHEELGMMPLTLYGDGIRKTITVAAALIRAKDGILLIDEIETGIHKKALVKFAEWLSKASMHYNVQLFLSTHSIEAMDALLLGSDDNQNEEIVGYRLESYHSSVHATRFSQNKLKKLRYSQGLDIR